jgi:chromate transporter
VLVLWSLFIGFARVGTLGFGGGPSMLPLLQVECVSSGWVSNEQFLEGLAVGSALPGPIATKMAVYIGWHVAGPLGAVVATLGVVLPSAVLMASLGAFVLRYREHPAVSGALTALKPAVIGMLAFVAWDLGAGVLTGAVPVALAAGAFALLAWVDVHPAVVIGLAACTGAVFLR